MMLHARPIKLDRVLNFRDFGGSETADGARIILGKLYRSASFHDATDADIARLDALNVRFVVDLRRPAERAHEPNRWRGETGHAAPDRAIPSPARALPPHLASLLQSDVTPDSVAKYMIGLYRGIPFDPRLVDRYREWFAELGQGGAGIIHCSAGKDRTGVGCALTLFALGAREEGIYADFDFTNQQVDVEARLPRIHAQMEKQLGRTLDQTALRPMLGVNTDYLYGALDEIKCRHGNVDNYLEQVLGVGAEQRNILRERLSD